MIVTWLLNDEIFKKDFDMCPGEQIMAIKVSGVSFKKIIIKQDVGIKLALNNINMISPIIFTL
jgi:hypothetical protein